MINEGIAGKFLTNQSGAQPQRLTGNTSVAVAQVEGEGDEGARAGVRFALGFISGVTGIAPVATLATTAAQWLLYNPASNSRTIFIDSLGMVLVSGTGGATGGIVVAGGPVWGIYLPSTLPSANATDVTTVNITNPNSTSSLVCSSGATLATAIPCQFEIATSFGTASPVILTQSAVNRDLKGRIAIPPGQGFALFTYSGAGTSPLFAPVATYREYAVTAG